jgi:hypothetical protein
MTQDTKIKVLIWLGYWRDQMPEDAVRQLQDIIVPSDEEIDRCPRTGVKKDGEGKV